jgi:hypothetical protein
MFSIDERVLIISLYCVGSHPVKLDIVIRMCPVIRENVSCDIDYCVSLSLVIDICLLRFCIHFTMAKWSSGDVVNSFHAIPCAREEKGETRIPCVLPSSFNSRHKRIPERFGTCHCFCALWYQNCYLFFKCTKIVNFWLKEGGINNFCFDWLCITQFLHFFCSYCIAQFILLSIFSKRLTERLFLVTHCLLALYKGSIHQSDSL